MLEDPPLHTDTDGAGAGDVVLNDLAGELGARETFARSIKLRAPTFDETRGRRALAEELADYILDTAVVRGELAELRFAAQCALKLAIDSAPSVAGRTKPEREASLSRHHPRVARRIADARWLIARCGEEMDRLGGSDYDAASRAYTILSGS